MSSFSDQTFEERLTQLEQQQLVLRQLPLAALKAWIESELSPEASTFLLPHSVTSDSLSAEYDGFHVGTGSPETVVIGDIGDVYRNLSGGAGTTLYIKESGAATNTGWIAK